jgi:hypothetical protein
MQNQIKLKQEIQKKPVKVSNSRKSSADGKPKQKQLNTNQNEPLKT